MLIRLPFIVKPRRPLVTEPPGAPQNGGRSSFMILRRIGMVRMMTKRKIAHMFFATL